MNSLISPAESQPGNCSSLFDPLIKVAGILCRFPFDVDDIHDVAQQHERRERKKEGRGPVWKCADEAKSDQDEDRGELGPGGRLLERGFDFHGMRPPQIASVTAMHSIGP
jgi:hypothetical protein